MVDFFDAEQPISHLSLEIFIAARLLEAGVWLSPRASDGISVLREVEHTPLRARLCGEIWEIVGQTRHTFWLDFDRSAGVQWTLYFDPVIASPRRARNAAYALARPDEVEWRVTLTGTLKAGSDG